MSQYTDSIPSYKRTLLRWNPTSSPRNAWLKSPGYELHVHAMLNTPMLADANWLLCCVHSVIL